LYNLAALGEAQISVTIRPTVRIRERHGSYSFQNNQHIAWLEVADIRAGQQRRLCFDMMDNKYFSTEGGLLHCDVYFKRSYDSDCVAALDPRLRRKVLPYGLYYPVSSPHEKESIKRSLIYTFYTGKIGSDPLGFLKQLALPFWSVLRGRASKARGKIPCLQDLMADPEEAADAKIYFPTRVWDPAMAVDPDEKHAINEARVAVIRALKKEFGERFVGGLRESDFVRRTYPDCISHYSSKKADYMNLLRQNLIAVTTTGLVSSTGAKFPEYLAASRCIVSEPLRYETPYAIIPGTHYLPFVNPAECVTACDRLLRDSRFAAEMRRANHNLFIREVEPTATMRNVLRRAFELESSCQ
jgi:hypothetical protein